MKSSKEEFDDWYKENSEKLMVESNNRIYNIAKIVWNKAQYVLVENLFKEGVL